MNTNSITPTTSQSDECRAAFEAEYLKIYPAASFVRNELNPEEYLWEVVEAAWQMWKISRAQYAAELVRQAEDLDGFSEDADRIKTEVIAIINGGRE